MFAPPRCPYPVCRQHGDPAPDFCTHFGFYSPKCRPHPVPRFLCRSCGRTFSRQTFRADYRDHKPHLNQELFSRLVSGVGLRQAARELGLTVRNVQSKFRKLARHLHRLHRNLLRPASREVSFAFDEAQTFEGCRDTRPLTVPFVIEQESFFLVDARAGAVVASGGMNDRRRKAIAHERMLRGPRPDESARVVGESLALARQVVPAQAVIEVRSDRKSTYPGLLARTFGRDRVQHIRVSSKAKRNVRNPLHRINLMLAVARDLVSRLRRRSWLVSKRADRLDLHLAMFTCYRNYVRPRFNGEDATPAQLLGLLPRRLTPGELLGWRQDWQCDRCIAAVESSRMELRATARAS